MAKRKPRGGRKRKTTGGNPAGKAKRFPWYNDKRLTWVGLLLVAVVTLVPLVIAVLSVRTIRPPYETGVALIAALGGAYGFLAATAMFVATFVERPWGAALDAAGKLLAALGGLVILVGAIFALLPH